MGAGSIDPNGGFGSGMGSVQNQPDRQRQAERRAALNNLGGAMGPAALPVVFASWVAPSPEASLPEAPPSSAGNNVNVKVGE